jgi:CBS domain-containing membrane protein
VGPETDIEEAWALLRYHKVAMLPVLDGERRVVGTLSVVDILKRADLKTYEGLGERLSRAVRRRPALGDARLRAVADFMATAPVTASEDSHIVELVPLLSDQGLHHVPILDTERRLAGIITQSDLVAALYAGCASGRAARPLLPPVPAAAR